MSVEPLHEGLLAAAANGLGDALSFSFADPASEICGRAELRLGTDAHGRPTSSGFTLLLSGGSPLTSCVAPDCAGDGPRPERWDEVSAAGLRTSVRVPLERWSLSFGGCGSESFELEFAALGAALATAAPRPASPPESPSSVPGGSGSYEQVCRVTGKVAAAGRSWTLDCLGQRGHRWGELGGARSQLRREVGAWLDDPASVLLTAVRPPGADHGAELTSAYIIEGHEGATARVDDARLSTTYDGEGNPLRASLELWPSEDSDFPRRLAGEVIARESVRLGEQRIQCAFLSWRMEGQAGLGRYEIQAP